MAEKLIKPILEGLLGFRLYESKCGMAGVYSEYFYYPAFYKIIFHRDDLRIINEHKIILNNVMKRQGKPNSIDFVLKNIENKTFNSAFELKVKTGKKMDCETDVNKLLCFLKQNKNTRAYLIIFSIMKLKDIEKANSNKDKNQAFKDLLLSNNQVSNKYKKNIKYLDNVYYSTSNKTYMVTAFRIII